MDNSNARDCHQQVNSSSSERLRQITGMQPPAQNESPRANCTMDRMVYEATRNGYVDSFINALEQASATSKLAASAIIMQVTISSNSVLHESVRFGHTELTALLALNVPSLLPMKNLKGDTALHIATRNGNAGIISLLLEHDPRSGRQGCLTRMKNEDGNTALHEAVMNARQHGIERLISKDSEPWYHENKQGKSPLYLAVQNRNPEIVRTLLSVSDAPVIDDILQRLQGKSPVHAAIMERRIDILQVILMRKPELFQLKDAKDGNPLHLAAHRNYLEGVKFLLAEFGYTAFEYDGDGYLPVHVACIRGRSLSGTVAALLGHWPEPGELLTRRGKNVFHVAAEHGNHSMVKFFLRNPELAKLVNERDTDGNAPLHLAAMNWHSMVLRLLTGDRRVNLKLLNNMCLTAFDVVDEHTKTIGEPIQKRFVRAILHTAGTPRSKDLILSEREQWNSRPMLQAPATEVMKDRINTRMVVATLVAAVTFTAGITVPGGYNNSNPKIGMATLLYSSFFSVFVIFNSVAMHCSILALVILFTSQISGSYASVGIYLVADALQFVSLVMMSSAFIAGVYVTLTGLGWLADMILISGIVFQTLFWLLYTGLYFPLGLEQRSLSRLRYMVISTSILLVGNFL